MKSQVLIGQLLQMTQNHLAQVELLVDMKEEDLNWRENEGRWSVLECIEHLNRYGDFYLPEIDKNIKKGIRKQPERFIPGWLGNYFAKSMLPKEQLNKMKTFKSMDPIGSALDKAVIHKFVSQLKQMKELLEAAKDIDITRTKTCISISSWLKLRLGDTFRVVIYHNERHMMQIKRVLEVHASTLKMAKNHS